MDHMTITIDGMSCAHCVAAVREALGELPGVRAEDVRVGAATVAYDRAQVAPERILAAVTAAGYGVRAAA
jgi:copper chaperone CopZ